MRRRARRGCVDENLKRKKKIGLSPKSDTHPGNLLCLPLASRPEDVYPSLRIFLTNLHPPLLADLLRPSRVLSVSSGRVKAKKNRVTPHTTDGGMGKKWRCQVHQVCAVCADPQFSVIFRIGKPQAGSKQEREPAFSGSKRGDHGAGYDIVHER